MGKISMPQGRGSQMHNLREYAKYGRQIPENVDQSRTGENLVLCHIPVREAYKQIFGSAVEEYNRRQKRADRKISSYYDKIQKSGNGEKLFYEDVIQWGKMDDFKDESVRLTARDALAMYESTFEERNPHLRLIGAYIHMDEKSPHLHLDYIPVADGYKRGMKARNSLDKALRQQGCEPSGKEGKRNNATMVWKAREREYFAEVCHLYGLEVEPEEPTPDRKSLSVAEYKQARDEMLSEVSAEREETQKQVDQLKGDVADLKLDRDMVADIYTREVKENDKRIKEQKKQIEAQKAQLDKQKQAVAEASRREQSLQRSIHDLEDSRSKLKKETLSLRQEKKHMQVETAEAREDLSDAREELSDAKAELDATESRLSAVESLESKITASAEAYDSIMKNRESDDESLRVAMAEGEKIIAGKHKGLIRTFLPEDTWQRLQTLITDSRVFKSTADAVEGLSEKVSDTLSRAKRYYEMAKSAQMEAQRVASGEGYREEHRRVQDLARKRAGLADKVAQLSERVSTLSEQKRQLSAEVWRLDAERQSQQRSQYEHDFAETYADAFDDFVADRERERSADDWER